MKINKLNELIPWAYTDFEIKTILLVKYFDSTTLVWHQKRKTWQQREQQISDLWQAAVVYAVGPVQSSLVITAMMWGSDKIKQICPNVRVWSGFSQN